GGPGGRGRRGGGDMFGDRGSQSAAIPVQVTAVKRGDISTFLLQTTTIEAEKQVDILAKVTGLVTELPTEEGIRVRKGDILCKLDEAELRIDFMQAKVRTETDKAALDRAKSMLDKNLIAEENYDAARLQYESSKAASAAAELRLEYMNVRSPIDGVVTLRHVELGQRVNVNDALFQVADFNPLRAKIYVPEKDMRRIFEGQKAKITAESEPGSEFAGVVKMISPIVDPTSGTAKVTIDIVDSQNKLKPGMFASVYITTETHTNTLIMAKKALILESDLDQVYVFREGTARKASLKLGFTSGDDVEVLEGLEEGDLVVTAGQEGLREGLPIRIPGHEGTLTQETSESVGARTLAANDTEPGRPDRTSDESRQTAGRPSEGGAPRSGESRGFRQSGRGFGDGPVDPERVKRMEERLMQNPDFKAVYEKRLKEDPAMKDDPEKKMAFFRELFRSMGMGRRRGS
ncbi:efflux RND transporter periplasmic adaptor subunit, partial [bacterium]|nr:efflux RND transporter periplasmic adaptor subunit [bacterium]